MDTPHLDKLINMYLEYYNNGDLMDEEIEQLKEFLEIKNMLNNINNG